MKLKTGWEFFGLDHLSIYFTCFFQCHVQHGERHNVVLSAGVPDSGCLSPSHPPTPIIHLCLGFLTPQLGMLAYLLTGLLWALNVGKALGEQALDTWLALSKISKRFLPDSRSSFYLTIQNFPSELPDPSTILDDLQCEGELPIEWRERVRKDQKHVSTCLVPPVRVAVSGRHGPPPHPPGCNPGHQPLVTRP